METYTIYTIRNSNRPDMAYIGCTKDLSNRRKAHKYRALKEKVDHPLYNDMREKGWENFHFCCVETFEGDQKEADEKERFYIEALGCIYPNGYNLYSGGTSGWKIHKLTLKKNKGLFEKGHTPWTKGKSRSQEVKDKISKTKAERNHPPSMLGKHQPLKICPYCGKTGGASGMALHHFDKCKKRQ